MTDARYQQHDDFCQWHEHQNDAACRCSASRTRRVQAASDAAYGDVLNRGFGQPALRLPIGPPTVRVSHVDVDFGYDPVAASNAVDHFAGPLVQPQKQSRIDSFCESLTNTAIGFVLSLLTWAVVAWAYGIPMPWSTNLQITAIFTVVSIARQYVLRRAFDGKSVWRAIRG